MICGICGGYWFHRLNPATNTHQCPKTVLTAIDIAERDARAEPDEFDDAFEQKGYPLSEYESAMETEGIPSIIAAVQRRESSAADARRRIMGV